MTSGLTTREVSQRLLYVGFSARTTAYYADKGNGVFAQTKWEFIHDNDAITPAYSASTLFEWLRNYEKDSHQEVDIVIYSDELYFGELRVDYKTSLADMLAEAILWILTQAKGKRDEG